LEININITNLQSKSFTEDLIFDFQKSKKYGIKILIISGLMKIIGESIGRKKAHNIQQSDHAALFADAQKCPRKGKRTKSQRTGTARTAAVVRFVQLFNQIKGK
jgi:hypothetical protein